MVPHTSLPVLLILAVIISYLQVSSLPANDEIRTQVISNAIEKLQKKLETKNINKREVDCTVLKEEEPPMRRSRTPLTEEEKKKRQAEVFQGLLHFATVVNHIDTFLMDKGKIILKSLGKMVASEEDKRFDI